MAAIVGFLIPLLLPHASISGQEGSSLGPFADFRQAITEAEDNLKIREHQIAESWYRTATYEGWIILGSLAESVGDLEEARKAYEKAITSVADVRRARLALAGVLRHTREYEEAEAILRLLIAEDKNDFLARRLLSDTLADAGRDEESIQELEQLVSMNPGDLETLYFLATAYLAQDRLDEADFLMARLAEAIPTAQTHVLIGRAYRDYDQVDRARRAFDSAIELDPLVKRARFYQGTTDLRQHGNPALETAIEWFEGELKVNPEDTMTNLYLGMALVDGRRHSEAIPHLEAASRSSTVRADALQFLGRSLLGENRLEEAIAVFRRGLEALQVALADRPSGTLTELEARQMSQFHYQLAQTLQKTGDRESAAVHFEAAKEYQLRQKETAQELLDRYLAAGTGEDDAGAALRKEEPPPETSGDGSTDEPSVLALRESVETALARSYLNLGVLKARAKKPALAADLFQQAADLAPELDQVQYSLGVARFNAGQFAEAAEPLSRSLARRPGDAQLEQMLALSWFNANEYGKAADALVDLPGRSSNRALQYTYGVALVRSGRAEEAERVFSRLLAGNADWPELNVLLAQANASQGDFNTAVELLEQALDLDPEVAEAHGTLGEIYMRKGELEKAEQELRLELLSHPGDTRTMFTLATVLDMAREQTEAMTILRALLDLDPKLGKGRYLLGKVLLAQGSLEDALEQLEASVGLMPEDANAHYQLGQAYQKLGRRDEARKEFDIFRQLKSERR
jgi:tetratricopeptide (TPR) repeat protein